jgi:23S rRNA (uracil1939-C5)-methyltransferase
VAPLDAGTDLEPLRYSLPEFAVTYDFEPTDFVQINAAINQAMVSRVIALLELDSQSRVLDLYCGLGNFTLPLARRAGAVLGIEGDATLVSRARHNAQMNGLNNAQFVTADLIQPLPLNAPYLAGGFSHVVLDPPRAGALEVMPTIAHLAPRKVAYISCHPGSLARDIAVLVHEFGFSLRAAGVLDMFPHTTHVESLAVLTPPKG